MLISSLNSYTAIMAVITISLLPLSLREPAPFSAIGTTHPKKIKYNLRRILFQYFLLPRCHSSEMARGSLNLVQGLGLRAKQMLYLVDFPLVL